MVFVDHVLELGEQVLRLGLQLVLVALQLVGRRFQFVEHVVANQPLARVPLVQKRRPARAAKKRFHYIHQ